MHLFESKFMTTPSVAAPNRVTWLFASVSSSAAECLTEVGPGSGFARPHVGDGDLCARRRVGHGDSQSRRELERNVLRPEAVVTVTMPELTGSASRWSRDGVIPSGSQPTGVLAGDVGAVGYGRGFRGHAGAAGHGRRVARCWLYRRRAGRPSLRVTVSSR